MFSFASQVLMVAFYVVLDWLLYYLASPLLPPYQSGRWLFTASSVLLMV